MANSSEKSTPAPFLHTGRIPFADLNATSTLFTSRSAPLYPMAQSTRPQLASAPNMAAFSRLLVITLLATTAAVFSSAAPVTSHSSSLVAPSPSPAMERHNAMVMVFSAFIKVSKAGPSSVISPLPASPLARIATISLVDVSPSTLSMLKVFCTSWLRAFCSMAAEMAASVVRNTSMVAMLGWIMPLPLAMPPIRQVLPSISNSTATFFMTVSVVMMALAASSSPVSDNRLTSLSMPLAMGVMFSFWPMTPVEAITMSSLLMPSFSAARLLIFSAISMPSLLQVLALPLLQSTAWAMPSAIWFLVTVKGAPFTRFVV